MRLGLFGLPGAGKGTQAERMAKKWAIPHISTGEMFRELERDSSSLGTEVRGILARGELVPDELVTKMTFARLAKNDCQNGFILDGFPRTRAQGEALEASSFSLHALFSIEVSREEIIARLSARRVCTVCKSVYGALEYAQNDRQPNCPKDGHPLVQRSDDMPEAIRLRLALFERNFAPIMGFYEKLGRVYHVDGTGTEDAVFARICHLVSVMGGISSGN